MRLLNLNTVENGDMMKSDEEFFSHSVFDYPVIKSIDYESVNFNLVLVLAQEAVSYSSSEFLQFAGQ